jgi:hypothetical protein
MKVWEFDYKTCLEICRGTNEAFRKFAIDAKWLHDDRNSLIERLMSTDKILTAREAEIVLLKQALLDAEEKPSSSPLNGREATRF